MLLWEVTAKKFISFLDNLEDWLEIYEDYIRKMCLYVVNCKMVSGQNTLFFFFNFFSTFLFIFGTERDRALTGEGQRERETQKRKQAPGSEPSAQSLTRGSNSRTARSWPGWSRTLNRLRHPGAPNLFCSWPYLITRPFAWFSYIFLKVY